MTVHPFLLQNWFKKAINFVDKQVLCDDLHLSLCSRSNMLRFSCVLLIFCAEVNAQNTCGVPKIAKGNIFFGSEVKHGQYPW